MLPSNCRKANPMFKLFASPGVQSAGRKGEWMDMQMKLLVFSQHFGTYCMQYGVGSCRGENYVCTGQDLRIKYIS